LVTPQTGPEGKIVKKIYIEEGSKIEKEFYVSMIVDRVTDGITIIASTEGGMEIEEVAEKTPEKIYTLSLKPNAKLKINDAKKVASSFGLKENLTDEMAKLVLSLHKAMVSTDSLMIEINPLVITKEDKILALDAKIDFDENAF
jgi:succinyl-CoA synthetase beta subunit